LKDAIKEEINLDRGLLFILIVLMASLTSYIALHLNGGDVVILNLATISLMFLIVSVIYLVVAVKKNIQKLKGLEDDNKRNTSDNKCPCILNHDVFHCKKYQNRLGRLR